jgi:Fe-S-cluster containining protein
VKMLKADHRKAVPVEKAVLKAVEVEETTATERAPVPCFRCGVCCTCYQPPLSLEDIDGIASVLGTSRSECISKYTVKVPIKEGYLLKQTGSGCVFLAWDADGRARCSIYASRPRACREWIPSLSKPECLEGLAKFESDGRIMLVEGLFRSREEQKPLYEALKRVPPSAQAFRADRTRSRG